MKISNKLVAVASCAALAFTMFGVVGCSSNEEPVNREITTADINAQDIEVTSVGYTVLDEQSISYAFTVNNPNAGYIADGVTFTVEAYDADDQMIVGTGDTIHEVYPNIETASASVAYISGDADSIDRFEVKPLMEHVRWTKTDLTSENLSEMFQVSNVNIESTDGQLQITGTVSCDLGSDDTESGNTTLAIDTRQNAQVTVLLLNGAGDIICGGESNPIMLDASMVGEYGAPAAVDEEGNIIEDTGDEPVMAAGSENLASTSFLVTIPGIVNYDSYKVVVTPGM